MTQNESLRAIVVKTLEQLDELIRRENNADAVTKMVVDETNKLATLQKEVSDVREDIKKFTNEKGTILVRAREEAAIIVKEAESKEKEAAERLANTKRLERIAQELKEDALKIQLTHQAALNDVLAQKERIKAAIG